MRIITHFRHSIKSNIEINQNSIENYYFPVTNVSLLKSAISVSNNTVIISMYEYGHKTNDGQQFKLNIYLFFTDCNDGSPLFHSDLAVLSKPLLSVDSHLSELKMLNNQNKNNKFYFMILYNDGNALFANVYCLSFVNGMYQISKVTDSFHFISANGPIGFDAFISDTNNHLLITWSEYVFPIHTFNAQIWNVSK